tara:strand:+ start:1125 stop:3089 length:1965 start_codon:yes stop_codon:yes gene_type:complete
MSDTTTQVVQRGDPATEALRVALMQDAQALARQRMNQGLPAYQIAGLSTAEQQAAQRALSSQGQFQPFLNQASGAITAGQGLISNQGVQGLQQGLQTTQGAQPLFNQAGQLGQNVARTGMQNLSGFSDQASQLGLGAFENLMATGQASQLYGADAASAIRQAGQAGAATNAFNQQQLAQLGIGAEGIAGVAARQAGALQSPLSQQLGQATSGAAGASRAGQAGLMDAASRARASTAEAQQGLMQAGNFGQSAAVQGIGSLQGTTGAFDPSSIGAFTNQFEGAAVEQALQDIARQGQIAQQGVRAQAVGSGAFGGSRQAIAEQELQRNVLEQQGRTAGQMRQAGFESASQRAQQAFEAQQGRAQAAAGLTGQLGQAGAGTALQAAGQAGQLGLSAEQLAQGSAGQAAQLGLSTEQFRSANAQAQAQTGLSIAQLTAQTGLNANQLAAQYTNQGGQLGLQQSQQGLQGATQAGQLGLAGAQQNIGAQQAASQQGIAGTQAAGQLSQASSGLGMNAAEQLSQLGQQQSALGQGIGAFGQQFGTMAGQLGQLGVQQAGIGQLGQQLTTQDMQNLLATGSLERGVQQANLDATRMSNLQNQQQPFQSLGFLSDIYSGVPSAQSTVTASSAPQVSPFQTLIGLGSQLGTAALGARSAGII